MLVYKKMRIYLAHKLSRKEKAAIFLMHELKSRMNPCAVRLSNAKWMNIL